MLSPPARDRCFCRIPDGSTFAIGYEDGTLMIGPTDRNGKDTTLKGHKDRIWTVAFSPDGKQIASATSHEVLLWDIELGEARKLCGGTPPFTDVAFDPRGKYLAWSSRDGSVTVQSLQTSQTQSFQAEPDAVWTIAFSRDGALFASSGDEGRIVVRGTDDWSVQETIETGDIDVISIAFDRKGAKIAAASLAGPVGIWALGAGPDAGPLARVPARAEKRWKVRYSPDGSTIAIASWDGTVGFWDAETLQYRGTIDGNDERVNDISFLSVNGARKLLTAAESGAVRFWDLTTVRPIFADTANDRRETLVGRYSSDGMKFAAGGKDGSAALFRVTEDGSLQSNCAVKHETWVTSVAFSPDGSLGLSGDRGENGVKLWGTENCQEVGHLIPTEEATFRAVAFSPAGDHIAWSGNGGDLWLMRLDSDAAPTQLSGVHTEELREIDFNDDGTLLVSGGKDGKVLVWDVAKRTLALTLRDGGPAIFTTRFGAGGRLVAAGGTEDQIQVWDLARPKSEELIKKLPAVGGSNRLGFDEDGTILAVGADKRYISMWSTTSWDKIFQLNVGVGVRSIFDFHPTRGDLAFDGEKGLIRVLQARDSKYAIQPKAVRRGMEIYFDELPTNFSSENIESIATTSRSCDKLQGVSLETSR